MPRRTRNTTSHKEPHIDCAIDGCMNAGEYKAPRRRGGDARDTMMLCMEHIREFNKSYDYFQDMNEDEILSFMKDAVLGHRPTWKMGKGPNFSDIDVENGFRRYFDDIPVDVVQESLPSTIRKALGLFELRHPTDISTIKQRYKALVKRTHPDINKKANAEETFKQITQSYRLLIDHYQD